MSSDRPPRRRRRRAARRPDAPAAAASQRADEPAGDADAPEGGSTPLVRVRRVDRAERAERTRRRRESDLVPRPSKMRYILLFFAGVFVGRVAEVNFAPELLSMLDLITYGAIALGIAWMWRSWARRAVEQRHLQAQRRQQSAERREEAQDDADES